MNLMIGKMIFRKNGLKESVLIKSVTAETSNEILDQIFFNPKKEGRPFHRIKLLESSVNSNNTFWLVLIMLQLIMLLLMMTHYVALRYVIMKKLENLRGAQGCEISLLKTMTLTRRAA